MEENAEEAAGVGELVHIPAFVEIVYGAGPGRRGDAVAQQTVYEIEGIGGGVVLADGARPGVEEAIYVRPDGDLRPLGDELALQSAEPVVDAPATRGEDGGSRSGRRRAGPSGYPVRSVGATGGAVARRGHGRLQVPEVHCVVYEVEPPLDVLHVDDLVTGGQGHLGGAQPDVGVGILL